MKNITKVISIFPEKCDNRILEVQLCYTGNIHFKLQMFYMYSIYNFVMNEEHK